MSPKKLIPINKPTRFGQISQEKKRASYHLGIMKGHYLCDQ